MTAQRQDTNFEGDARCAHVGRMETRTIRNTLPAGLAPRGLSRVQAAAYVGVSPSTFDRMMRDGLMPPPIRVYSRTVWDRERLDAAIGALSGIRAEADQWDRLAL